MQVRFNRDRETGLAHCEDHNVSERQAIQVLSTNPLRLRGGDGTTIVLGQTYAGRYLRIICRIEDDDVFVITAYDLRGKALLAFKRRRRRKGS